MVNYYKYLPVSREDESWGLCVLNAGCTHVETPASYPVKTHPAHHYFNWDMGRVLNEYQLIYISRGGGVFESDSCTLHEIKAGTIIILFPGERHRYKPDEVTGWDEYWIGVKGDIVDNLVKGRFLQKENPSLYIGYHEGIFDLFNKIIETTKEEKSGYQPLISGAALYLMGSFHAVIRQHSTAGGENEAIVNQARLLFRSNILENFSPEQAAETLQVGYSWFRKVFKTHTGLSPGQYYIQLKVERAKELLNNPGIPIKEIAYSLRFDNYFYFSKLFKEKTGLSPSAYRQRATGELE